MLKSKAWSAVWQSKLKFEKGLSGKLTVRRREALLLYPRTKHGHSYSSLKMAFLRP